MTRVVKSSGCTKYTNSTLMPFGKYKGEKLANVPESYLAWWYDENDNGGHPLAVYIKEQDIDLNAHLDAEGESYYGY